MGDLLRARGYEVDDWHIDVADLKDLRGFGPIEHDFSKARTVVGTYRPASDAGKSLILPGWSVADCQAEIIRHVAAAAREHRFLSNNPPGVEWSGFLSEGYELKNSAEAEAAFGKAYDAVYGGAVEDLVFTALTDTRFYGLNYNIPSLCFGASGAAMHGFNEYVDLESLRKSTKTIALFIAEWCGVERL